jgi:hypothetical protein
MTNACNSWITNYNFIKWNGFRLNPSVVRGQVVLHLSLIVLIEEEPKGKLLGSDKLLLHLAPPKQGKVFIKEKGPTKAKNE